MVARPCPMRLPADTWTWCACSARHGLTRTRRPGFIIRLWPTHEGHRPRRNSALLSSTTESRCDEVTQP
eukprot:15289199-Heterocapsa_arctica.AAC.1